MDCHTPYLTDERGPNLRVLLNGEEVAEVRGENGPRPTVIPVRLPPGGSDVRLRYFGGGDGEMLPPSGRSPLHVGDLRVAPDDVELDAPPRLPGDDGKHFRTLANETVLRLRNPRDAPVDAEIRFQGFRAYSRKEQPAFYRDGVRAVDVEVGRLLRRLERAGLAGTTAVLFTADHGEMLGEHGAWGHRRAVYEEDVRVPLLIRGPGVPAGSEERRRVGLADLHRLLTALPRRGFQEWSEGLGPEGSPGRDFVATSYPPQAAWRRVALFRGTRKLILRPQGDPELYDLATDPREQANRWEELRKEPVASAMLRDAREEIERAMEATSVRRDSLSAETAERLQALGYVD
jgi:arylsulfatase A-like enzyme